MLIMLTSQYMLYTYICSTLFQLALQSCQTTKPNLLKDCVENIKLSLLLTVIFEYLCSLFVKIYYLINELSLYILTEDILPLIQNNHVQVSYEYKA